MCVDIVIISECVVFVIVLFGWSESDWSVASDRSIGSTGLGWRFLFGPFGVSPFTDNTEGKSSDDRTNVQPRAISYILYAVPRCFVFIPLSDWWVFVLLFAFFD